MSDSVRPYRRQPTRLPHPWDSPGTNTGVGCHFLLQCMKVKIESEVAQPCLTLHDPMDCSLPGSSTHGVFQARVLEWLGTVWLALYLYRGNGWELWRWKLSSTLSSLQQIRGLGWIIISEYLSIRAEWVWQVLGVAHWAVWRVVGWKDAAQSELITHIAVGMRQGRSTSQKWQSSSLHHLISVSNTVSDFLPFLTFSNNYTEFRSFRTGRKE